jgi:hypothetical protein
MIRKRITDSTTMTGRPQMSTGKMDIGATLRVKPDSIAGQITGALIRHRNIAASITEAIARQNSISRPQMFVKKLDTGAIIEGMITVGFRMAPIM